MRVAYADPPYIGQAKRHYGCEEVAIAQTSLALFLTAADAFRARFGDPR